MLAIIYYIYLYLFNLINLDELLKDDEKLSMLRHFVDEFVAVVKDGLSLKLFKV